LVIGADELLRRVALDDEELAPPDSPLVVVDLSTAPASDADAGARARLASLPVVLVGFGPVRDERLAEAVDVVTSDPGVVAAVTATVTAAPRASVALALLLRGRDGRTLDEALAAESATYSVLQAGPEFAAWIASRSHRPVPPDVEPAVLTARDGAVLSVVLNRPQRHNAYSLEMRDGLVAALRVAAADQELRVVLSGRGPSFSSGGDLSEFGTFPDPATAHLVRLTRSAARLMAALGDRVEAHVHGACLGAGVELAAFARRVIARRDATFGLPEVPLGLVPGAGGTASLPPRIGRQRTARLALTGERIDAGRAMEWGLVDDVVDELPAVDDATGAEHEPDGG
jgi:enoyl-CoA hydratase/carnithine racemase